MHLSTVVDNSNRPLLPHLDPPGRIRSAHVDILRTMSVWSNWEDLVSVNSTTCDPGRPARWQFLKPHVDRPWFQGCFASRGDAFSGRHNADKAADFRTWTFALKPLPTWHIQGHATGTKVTAASLDGSTAGLSAATSMRSSRVSVVFKG